MKSGKLSAAGQPRIKYCALFWLATLALGSFCLLTGFSQAKFPEQKTGWDIRENGYFRADLTGRFFEERERLDVYDTTADSSIIWDSVVGKYVSIKDKTLPSPWEGEPYYRERMDSETERILAIAGTVSGFRALRCQKSARSAR
jgi:hypothetical protein